MPKQPPYRRDPWANMNEAERHDYEVKRITKLNEPVQEQLNAAWRKHDAAAEAGDVTAMGESMLRINYLDEMLKPLPSPPLSPLRNP